MIDGDEWLMQKQAPSFGRILVAVGFALSCFGLILFLWVAFGGPIPLQPQGYKITAYFPEATQLAQESDVRIGGVSVGKVKSVELAPPQERVNGKDTTEATIEIDPQYAPISTDARAILRQKTLLGETYIELTSGTNPTATRRRSRSAPRRTPPTPSPRTSRRSRRAARSGSLRPSRRPRSTRSSTPSTSRRGPPSRSGCRTRRSRSRAAAST